MVGVLVLVHQHVAEPPAVGVGDRREGAEDVDHLADQVVEVHGVGLAQPLRVPGVDRGDGGRERVVPGGGGKGLVVDQFVLQRRDLVLHGFGREPFRVQVQPLGHLVTSRSESAES